MYILYSSVSIAHKKKLLVLLCEKKELLSTTFLCSMVGEALLVQYQTQ